MAMEKYKQFDESMNELEKIEQKLQNISTKKNISLSEVMALRESAATHFQNCNEILKELKEKPKQNNE